VKIAILHDASASTGRPDEQDAIVQVRWVEGVLGARGVETARVPVTLDLESARAALEAIAPDAVFNLVESVGGHGRLIHLAPALLECMAIPFTGSPSAPVFVTTHKTLTKRMLRAAGLPTPDWTEAGGPSSWTSPPEHGSVIVKPVCEDASVGIDDDSVTAVFAKDEIQRRLARAGRPGEYFAEGYIDGREFNVAMLEVDGEPVVLPPAEMTFDGYPASRPRIVGYKAKWEHDSFEYVHTVRRFDFPAADATLVEHVKDLCRACWRLFGIRGYARVDFRVDAKSRPFILEVNANPCLSPNSGFAAAADRAGLAGADVVDRIVRAAHASLPGGAHAQRHG
jgi:D-alanine-D-alanine ligase